MITYFASILLGALAGSFSGYNLIRQVSSHTQAQSRTRTFLPFVRIGLCALIGWHLLQWGTIPFILFGGSLVIAKWIAILALHE